MVDFLIGLFVGIAIGAILVVGIKRRSVQVVMARKDAYRRFDRPAFLEDKIYVIRSQDADTVTIFDDRGQPKEFARASSKKEHNFLIFEEYFTSVNLS